MNKKRKIYIKSRRRKIKREVYRTRGKKEEEERRKSTTMGGSRVGVLEGWRLLNQQRPLGGWFSDASSTSATESFPSYLSLLPAHFAIPCYHSPLVPLLPCIFLALILFPYLFLVIALSLSLSLRRLFSLYRSFFAPGFLLRYTLRFVLTNDYE